MHEELPTRTILQHYSKTFSQKSSRWNRRCQRHQWRILFVIYFCYRNFIIATLLFCICVYRSSSVLAIHCKRIPIYSLHQYFQLLYLPSVYLVFLKVQLGHMVKWLWEPHGVYHFLQRNPFHPKLVFNMCFHYQLLLPFDLVSLSSLFLINAFVECIISA